jgi:hypothetical protein
MPNNSARIGSSASVAGTDRHFKARRIGYFKFVSRLGERAKSEHLKARGRSNDLAWLRRGNHIRQVGVRAGRWSGVRLAFGGAIDPPLLLIQLLLLT